MPHQRPSTEPCASPSGSDGRLRSWDRADGQFCLRGNRGPQTERNPRTAASRSSVRRRGPSRSDDNVFYDEEYELHGSVFRDVMSLSGGGANRAAAGTVHVRGGESHTILSAIVRIHPTSAVIARRYEFQRPAI